MIRTFCACVVLACTGCLYSVGTSDEYGSAPDGANEDDGSVAPACVATCVDNGITNLLDGSCFWLQCRSGAEVAVGKPPGVECVYRAPSGDFAIGHCDERSICH